MELFTYLGLAFLTVFFSLSRDIVSSRRMFFFIWVVAYIALILVVRTNFDFDMVRYADAMSYSSLSIYFLKEPVVWLGQRYLFSWIQNSFLVFAISDLLIGLVLFRSFRNFNLPQYAFFSILIFFLFVLGMQNVYRQWVATIFFLYCFSLVWRQTYGIKKYIMFAFSVLSHNVAAIFIPLLFFRQRRVLGKLLWYSSFLIAFIGIILGSDTKSSAETGADLAILYLLLLTFLIILIPLLDKGFIRKIRQLEYKLLFSLFLLSSFSVFVLSSAGAERVSMFCLMISYPILVSLFENRFKQKFIVRVLFSLIGFIPMFLFDVSVFILGT